MVKAPLISKLQRYSTKDGPGIRTTVFFLGCNKKCLWCSNPELMTAEPKVLHYRNKCQLCGECTKLSNGTIKIDSEGLHIDRVNCQNLAEIADCCPFEAYEKIGTTYSVSELSELLLRDEIFYRQSGGGVTFSGGEAVLYPEYLKAVAKELKAHGIHITVDTAGLWEYTKISELLDYVDLWLFDMKTYDANLHRRCTGVDNGVILQNLSYLAKAGATINLRLVLVPGVNDNIADLKKRLDLAAKLKIKQVDILYYHKLGLGKYQALDLPYRLNNTPLYSEKDREKIEELVKLYPFSATFSE